jgi:hypothetical protein
LKIEIKSWITGGVLFAVETDNWKLALEAAVKSGAVLRGAVLSGADLSGAVLSDAVLRGAVLSGAVLSGAVLSGADLSGAVLSNAVLRGAVLSGAVLSGAVLSGADLSGADLSGADLRGADLRDAVNVPYITIIGSRHSLTLQRDGQLTVGCHCKPLTWWMEYYKSVGEKEGYDDATVKEYGEYIKRLAAFTKKATNS